MILLAGLFFLQFEKPNMSYSGFFCSFSLKIMIIFWDCKFDFQKRKTILKLLEGLNETFHPKNFVIFYEIYLKK